MCKFYKTSIIILLFISFLASCNGQKGNTDKLDDISNEFSVIKEEMCTSLTKSYIENRYDQNGVLKELDYFEFCASMKKTVAYFDSDVSNQNLQKMNLLINDYCEEMEKHKSTKDKKVRKKMDLDYTVMRTLYKEFVSLQDSYKKYDTLTQSEKNSITNLVIVLLDKDYMRRIGQ